jgi:hypothetical protein
MDGEDGQDCFWNQKLSSGYLRPFADWIFYPQISRMRADFFICETLRHLRITSLGQARAFLFE